jgi:hypothetical protein
MSGRTDMWRHVVRRGQCHHHMALVRSQRSLNSHKINTRVQFRRLSDAGVGLSGAEDVSQLLQSVGLSESERALVLRGATPNLSKDDIESNISFILDDMRIPISDLRKLLIRYPGILVSNTPDQLRQKYDVLVSAWPSEKQLAQSIVSYPTIFDDNFTVKLQKCMSALQDIGFDSDDIARMVVKKIDIIDMRKFELNNAVKKLKSLVESSSSSKEAGLGIVLKFLAKEPVSFLDVSSVVQYIEQLQGILGGVSQSDTAILYMNNDKLRKVTQENIQSIVQIKSMMMQFCREDESLFRHIIVACPSILTMQPRQRVGRTIRVLNALDVSVDDVKSYPRLFLRDPLEVVGPRIAYMKLQAQHKKATMPRLASFLSLGESKFLSKYVGSSAALNEFETIKESMHAKFLEKKDSLSHADGVSLEQQTSTIATPENRTKGKEVQKQGESSPATNKKTTTTTTTRPAAPGKKRFWKNKRKPLQRLKRINE